MISLRSRSRINLNVTSHVTMAIKPGGCLDHHTFAQTVADLNHPRIELDGIAFLVPRIDHYQHAQVEVKAGHSACEMKCASGYSKNRDLPDHAPLLAVETKRCRHHATGKQIAA